MSSLQKIALLAAAVLEAGCGYYDASLLAPAGNGGSAGADSAAGGGPATCEHAGPPAKPSVTNAGGDLELVFALDHIAFVPPLDAGVGALGYDIDKTCSCQGESDSCLVPTWATKQCDGPQGRDNAAGLLLQQVAVYVPSFGQDRWNTDLQAGVWNGLARIRGYNGLPDDDQIEVSMFTADAYWRQHTLPDGGHDLPKWDGTDVWPVFSSSLEPIALADGGTTYDLQHANSTDTKAYVSGGVAVAMLPKGVLQVDPTMRLVFTDMYMAAKLVKTAQGWEMQDGTLAGVWTLEDVFKQLGYVEVLDMPMCKGNQVYDVLKKTVCKYTDIYRSRGTPTTPCDSLSIGMAYSSKQAHLGIIRIATENPKKCTGANDPASDSCDK